MARKKITAFDPLFTRMILNATIDDFKLNISGIVRKEKIYDLTRQRFKRFWIENQDKFNIEVKVELKEQFIKEYQERLAEFDINIAELLGEYLGRKQAEADEKQRLQLEKMRKQAEADEESIRRYQESLKS